MVGPFAARGCRAACRCPVRSQKCSAPADPRFAAGFGIPAVLKIFAKMLPMIFGSNPTYLYGEVFKEKFSTPDKVYKIAPLPVECSYCPARLVDESIEIFYAGTIFNTYVVSEEDRVCVLKSFDDKTTITCWWSTGSSSRS